MKTSMLTLKRAVSFAFTLTAIASTHVTVAHAGEPAPVEEAKQLFSKGLAQVDRGNLAEARDSFDRAYTLVPSADILWNLALTEKKLGRSKDALVHLRAYGESAMAKPEKVQQARTIEAELLGKVGRIATVAKTGTVVFVDGAMVTPGETVLVDVGPHSVEFRSSEAPKTAIVNVEAGALSEVTEPSASGKLTPMSEILTKPVETKTEKKTDIPWVTIGLGVGAGVAVLGGVYFGLQSSEKIDERERAWAAVQNQRSGCRPGDELCDRYTDAKHSAQLQQTASIALFTTAGLLGGAAIGSWLAKRSDDRVVSVAIAPNGFAAQGRF